MGHDHRAQRGWSRRGLLAATAGTTVVGGVAGCLGRGGIDGTVTMTAATDIEEIMYPKQDEDSIQEALWRSGLDEDITIEIQTVPSDSDARMEEAQAALQAGRGRPDLHTMDSGWTIPFILREQTRNLTETLSPDVIERVESEYMDAVVDTARHPQTDDIHALPIYPDLGFMLYREDLLEDAGHDVDWETEPPSWEEFSRAVHDAQTESDVSFGWTTQADAYEGLSCCSFNEVMTSWGGAYYGGEENLFVAGDRPITVDDENTVDAVRMMRTFIDDTDPNALEGYEEICPSAIVQWTEQESLAPFEAGDAVAHRNWSFSIAATGAEDAFGDDIGVTTMPSAVSEDETDFDGTGGSSSALGGWHIAISPYTDRTDACVQVLEAFATDEVMLTILELQGFLPPVIDLVTEASEDEIGPLARYSEAIERASEEAIARPVTDVWPEQSAVIYQAVNAAIRGAEAPEDAMGDLQTRLERSERDVAEEEL